MSTTQIDGADFENKIIRDELFAISGVRAKYPQCFLIKDGTYQFVGVWETVEALEECDSLPPEVLDNHPEIDTFTSVFFGRDKKEKARNTVLTFNESVREQVSSQKLAVFFEVLHNINKVVEKNNINEKSYS